MARCPVQPDHQAAVLDPPVRVQQASPGCPHVGPQGVCDEGVQPARSQSFDVVVEEEEDLAPSLAGGGVIEPCPFERTWVVQDAHAVRPGEPFDQRQCLEVGRAVVNQQELKVGFARGGTDGVDARAEESRLVAEGDDDGDPDASREPALDVECASPSAAAHV